MPLWASVSVLQDLQRFNFLKTSYRPPHYERNPRSLLAMSLESGAISRRIHGTTSLYDYSISTPMQTLPIPDDWLPMRGAYPPHLTFDIVTTRPVIEIGRFTNSYFNANVTSCKFHRTLTLLSAETSHLPICLP